MGSINKKNINDNEETKNFYKIFNIESYQYSLCFLIIIFNIYIIFATFAFNYYYISSIYTDVNELYFNKYLIEPISTEYENLNQEINIRLKTLDDVLLESKLENIRYLVEEIIQDNNSNYS